MCSVFSYFRRCFWSNMTKYLSNDMRIEGWRMIRGEWFSKFWGFFPKANREKWSGSRSSVVLSIFFLRWRHNHRQLLDQLCETDYDKTIVTEVRQKSRFPSCQDFSTAVLALYHPSASQTVNWLLILRSWSIIMQISAKENCLTLKIFGFASSDRLSLLANLVRGQ